MAQVMKRDYGTATSEEIHAGFAIATSIAETIKAIPNPAVQQMVKELIQLIQIEERKAQ